MSFSTKECAWSQTSMKLLGTTIEGIRGFEFKKNVSKEMIFAAGDEAVDITSGNKEVSGSIKLLKYEVDKLNDAAQLAGYDDITEIPHPVIMITCAFKLNPTSPIRYISTPRGLAFTELQLGMEQNAKMMEVSLPFIAQKMLITKS